MEPRPSPRDKKLWPLYRGITSAHVSDDWQSGILNGVGYKKNVFRREKKKRKDRQTDRQISRHFTTSAPMCPRYISQRWARYQDPRIIVSVSFGMAFVFLCYSLQRPPKPANTLWGYCGFELDVVPWKHDPF